MSVRRIIFVSLTVLALSALLILLPLTPVNAATAPPLGDAQSFAILAYSTVTNTGDSVITGDVGVSPGTAITGFPPGVVVSGTIYSATEEAANARIDAISAYNYLASSTLNPTDQILTGTDLGGLTLTPGVYTFSSSAQLTGTLTLNAQGNEDAVWVFQIGSTLTTASSSSVLMINGDSCHVYWQVGSSATLGSDTSFIGKIFALASISLQEGASVDGRLFALNGAVTLINNEIDASDCIGAKEYSTSLTIEVSPTTVDKSKDGTTTISGYLTDNAGLPVAGKTIILSYNNGTSYPIGTTTTNAEGYYEFLWDVPCSVAKGYYYVIKADFVGDSVYSGSSAETSGEGSLFVVPEAPFGVIAIVISMIAAFMVFKLKPRFRA